MSLIKRMINDAISTFWKVRVLYIYLRNKWEDKPKLLGQIIDQSTGQFVFQLWYKECGRSWATLHLYLVHNLASVQLSIRWYTVPLGFVEGPFEEVNGSSDRPSEWTSSKRRELINWVEGILNFCNYSSSNLLRKVVAVANYLPPMWIHLDHNYVSRVSGVMETSLAWIEL